MKSGPANEALRCRAAAFAATPQRALDNGVDCSPNAAPAAPGQPGRLPKPGPNPPVAHAFDRVGCHSPETLPDLGAAGG